ncbi:hypothetical protein OK349_12825 [Sphingomonas sp. BT-65]|uniref:hypothetical protein n=1 Tax=Sphingomonas sp. BT-65 TaxID=2989821 RepID=UPI002235F37C|nr:hypothetical protein [Sphingomonas sp. BT-65]MCW4462594.1 hypothetical protein [Sphingomonas sp. BT-65]
MRLLAVSAALAALSGCGEMSNEQQAALVQNAVANAEAIAENVTAEAEKAEKAAEAPNRDGWVGKWVGVEGLVLTIAKDPAGPGRYRLTNTYSLDPGATGTFAGVATEEGIAFTRPDGARVLRATDGAATGLKYLEGKKDCLTATVGEGYCRD